MEELTKAVKESTTTTVELRAAVAALSTKIDDMCPVVLDLQAWKPQVEQAMDSIRSDLGRLRRQAADLPSAPQAPLHKPEDHTPAASPPPTLPVHILPGDERSHGPDGHRPALQNRGWTLGDTPPVTSTPDKRGSHGAPLHTSPRAGVLCLIDTPCVSFSTTAAQAVAPASTSRPSTGEASWRSHAHAAHA